MWKVLVFDPGVVLVYLFFLKVLLFDPTRPEFHFSTRSSFCLFLLFRFRSWKVCNNASHMRTHSHAQSHAHTATHPLIHAYMHPLIHACMHPLMHAYMHPLMHACIHAPTHTCIHAPTHTCMHAPTHDRGYTCKTCMPIHSRTCSARGSSRSHLSRESTRASATPTWLAPTSAPRHRGVPAWLAPSKRGGAASRSCTAEPWRSSWGQEGGSSSRSSRWQ